MEKWADYLAVAVKFNEVHSHIIELEVRQDNGDNLGEKKKHTRATVIASIQGGTTYCTAYKKAGSDSLHKGKLLEIITIGGEKYLKTTPNEKKEDNLDNLPEF